MYHFTDLVAFQGYTFCALDFPVNIILMARHAIAMEESQLPKSVLQVMEISWI